jgi:AcrR family transcriptional regulator
MKLPRRSPKGERRRAEIIDAAINIYAQGGFSGASIASVAESVGLTLPGLLHYFPTKVALLLAVLERRDADGYTLVIGDEPHWRKIISGLRKQNRRNAGMPGIVKAFSILSAESLAENHPAAAWFKQRQSKFVQIMAETFKKGIEVGEISSKVKPVELSQEIMSVMDGMQTTWLRSPRGFDLISAFDAYLDRLLDDIAVDAERNEAGL